MDKLIMKLMNEVKTSVSKEVNGTVFLSYEEVTDTMTCEITTSMDDGICNKFRAEFKNISDEAWSGKYFMEYAKEILDAFESTINRTFWKNGY